jgi:hypothetical protein
MPGFDVEAALNGLAALVSTQTLEACGLPSTCLPRLESITAIGSTFRSHVGLISGDRPEPEMAMPFVEDAIDFIGAVAIMSDAPPHVAGVTDDEVCWRQRSGCALPSDVVGQHVAFSIVSQGGQNAVPLRLCSTRPETAVAFDDQTSPDFFTAPSATATRVKVAVMAAEFGLADLDLIGQSEEVDPATFADAGDGTIVAHQVSPGVSPGVLAHCRGTLLPLIIPSDPIWMGA